MVLDFDVYGSSPWSFRGTLRRLKRLSARMIGLYVEFALDGVGRPSVFRTSPVRRILAHPLLSESNKEVAGL